MIRTEQIYKENKDFYIRQIVYNNIRIRKRRAYISKLKDRLSPEIMKLSLSQLNKIEDKSNEIKLLIRCKKSIISRTKENEKLRLNIMPRYAFTGILKMFNKKISYDALKGKNAYLGTRVGKIKIVRKKTSRTKIDKKESFVELVRLSKEIAKSVYDRYEKGIINRNEFVVEMKAHTYSKENPKKPKWLIYRDLDFLPYWVIDLNSELGDKWKFKFTPTNFVTNETRSQIDFTNNCSNIEDILTTEQLGNRDKLFALLRFDPNYEHRFETIRHGI